MRLTECFELQTAVEVNFLFVKAERQLKESWHAVLCRIHLVHLAFKLLDTVKQNSGKIRL